MSSLAIFQGLLCFSATPGKYAPFLYPESELGDNCHSAGEGDPLWASPVSILSTHLTDGTHPVLSSDQIKHVLEVAAEYRGRSPE